MRIGTPATVQDAVGEDRLSSADGNIGAAAAIAVNLDFNTATARIGVAEGDLYPRLALSGSLGLAAEDLGDLFQHESGVFGFGPSLRWNLFDAGRLRQLVAAQEARTEQALVRWERTVLLALEESENAMTAFVREQTRRRSLLDAATSARLAVELARTQYTEGLSDFQTVLVAERALAELEIWRSGPVERETALAAPA